MLLLGSVAKRSGRWDNKPSMGIHIRQFMTTVRQGRINIQLGLMLQQWRRVD